MSIIMVAIILKTSIPLLIETAKILMNSVPHHIQINDLKKRLVEQIKCIQNVHELHVWQLAGEKIIGNIFNVFHFWIRNSYRNYRWNAFKVHLNPRGLCFKRIHVFVNKKDYGKWCVCSDYQSLHSFFIHNSNFRGVLGLLSILTHFLISLLWPPLISYNKLCLLGQELSSAMVRLPKKLLLCFWEKFGKFEPSSLSSLVTYNKLCK